MNHIDEGTIHAWLDGAVDATHAREIEAHVAHCAQCSAAVAEARGFVAASSRILSALDDVPANVTPKRAAPVRRQWRAARWVTGIAALLLGAVVLRTSSENAARVDSVVARATVDSAVPNSAVFSAAPPAVDSVRRTATAPARVEVAAPQQRMLSAGNTGRVAGRGGAANAAQSVGGAAAAAPREEVARRDRRADAVSAMAPQPSPLIPAPQVPADMMKVGSEPEALAGCYVVAEQQQVGLMEAAKAAVTDARARTSKAPTAGAAAPAAQTREYRAPEKPFAPPAMIRLDTVLRPRGYVARDASNDTLVGWWRRLRGDSITVDMTGLALVNLRTVDRRPCPQRTP